MIFISQFNCVSPVMSSTWEDYWKGKAIFFYSYILPENNVKRPRDIAWEKKGFSQLVGFNCRSTSCTLKNRLILVMRIWTLFICSCLTSRRWCNISLWSMKTQSSPSLEDRVSNINNVAVSDSFPRSHWWCQTQKSVKLVSILYWSVYICTLLIQYTSPHILHIRFDSVLNLL